MSELNQIAKLLHTMRTEHLLLIRHCSLTIPLPDRDLIRESVDSIDYLITEIYAIMHDMKKQHAMECDNDRQNNDN